MSKRLNPHRRLLRKQAMLRHEVQAYANAQDAGKLQEGRVRSGLDGSLRISSSKGGKKQSISGALTSMRPMKPAIWEGRGKLGKVIRGQLKVVKPGTKPRFSPK